MPTRQLAQLSPPEAQLWDGLGALVAERLEPRLDPRVVANRALIEGGRWQLHPFGPAFWNARRAAERLRRGSSALLRTDVSSFYPSVLPGVLCSALIRSGTDSSDAHRAAALVERWGSEGRPGLPIGPPASAVLANAVLRDLDGTLAGLPFLRWVDDVLIALRSPGAGALVLERIDESLDRLGLTRNEAKTAILDAPRPFRWLGRSLLP